VPQTAVNPHIAIANEIVALLEGLEGPESARGAEAAASLRRALVKVDAGKNGALEELRAGLSAKGVLDWAWTPKTSAKLEQMCAQYHQQYANTRGGT